MVARAQPCGGCELVEGAEWKTLSGFWYLYGETGLEGPLSCWLWEELVFDGASQNRESSESSDIGEYCKEISSLQSKFGKHSKNDHGRENFSFFLLNIEPYD